jgi:hypothetical protein
MFRLSLGQLTTCKRTEIPFLHAVTNETSPRPVSTGYAVSFFSVQSISLVLSPRKLERTGLAFHPNWLMQNFGFCNNSWIQRCLTPRDLKRELGEIDNTSITTVAAQVVIGTHENAIHRARLDTQRTEHAL